MGCMSSTAAKPAAGFDKTVIAPTAPAPTAEAKPDAAAKPKAQLQDVVAMLNEVFDKCDTNGDGNISRQELAAAFDNFLQCSDEQSEKSVKTLVMESGLNPYFNVFDQVDSNHDGKISRQEFQEHMHPAKARKVAGQLLKEVFDGIDVNKDGSLSRKELQDAYANLLNTTEEKSGKSWKNLLLDAGLNPDFYVFEQLDTNHDGKVTWQEFSNTLQPADPWEELFLKRTFAQLDVNGDGSVSQEELTSAFVCVLDMASPLDGKKTLRTVLQDHGIKKDFCDFSKLTTSIAGRINWAEFEANLYDIVEIGRDQIDFEGYPVIASLVTETLVSKQKVEEPMPTDVSQENQIVVTEEATKSAFCCSI